MEDRAPLVSVLLSVFNGQAAIEKTVLSILAQSFDDFEFIVVDDGSSDSTTEILTQMAKQDKRIRLLHNRENAGLIYSLNRALAEAEGQYVARIDCGDIAREDRLQKQVQALVADPDLVLVGSQPEWVDQHGSLMHTPNVPMTDSRIRSSLICGDNLVYHPTVMFKKIPGIEYDRYALLAEDYALWLKLLSYGKFQVLSEPLTKIEFNPGGATFRRRIEQTKSVGNILKQHRCSADNTSFALTAYSINLNWFENLQQNWFYRLSCRAAHCFMSGRIVRYYFYKALSAAAAPFFVWALVKRRVCRFLNFAGCRTIVC